MSKKMLKRSLALGALMAFVITGSAMAKTLEITHNEDGFLYTIDNSELKIAKTQSDLKNSLTTDEFMYGNFISSTKSFSNNIITIDVGEHSIGNTGEDDQIASIIGAYGRNSDIDYKNNTVNIISISDDNPVNIFGTYAAGNVINNTVNITGGKINITGRTLNAGTSNGVNKTVSDNTLNISNSTIVTNGRIEGGCDDRQGNHTNIVTNNTVNINKSIVDVSKISGGYLGYVRNNIVNIVDSKITDTEISGGESNLEVTNSEVNIGGETELSGVSLFGWNPGRTPQVAQGNKLNINDGWTGTVKIIQNFNTINIEEAEWNTTEAVVTVSDTLKLASDTTVDVGTVRVAGDDETFAPNASMTLISANQIDGTIANEGKASAAVYKGVATIYDATIEQEGNAIKLQLGDASSAKYNSEMNPQVLVIGESRAAATAFTNQGSELIETGLNALARDKAEDTKAFAAVYGNASEFATGSHVKVNGWSGIVGVGKTNANGLTMGAFFENGEGNYRTYNNVNGDFMRGDGDACYNGGGFIVRKDNANGVYTEASLRAGNLQNELRNAVRGSEGLAGYDIDTFYYGAHIGVGKIIPRGNEGDSIDVYGKFIYTHHDSEDFTIDGDKFHFDSVDSERLRLGFRINEVQTNKLSMYYGAAWEYEFGGDADNTVVGYDLSTPSLEGSTVIGEVGMHYNASEKWSLDLNVRGYGGQREGFSGSVQANYSF